MRPFFIIGMPASGKTTFGRALARRLGLRFIDLDFYISQRFHKSISEIFESEGEEAFRRKETAMLRETGEFDDVVIACGGGTPCFAGNMEYMNSRGLTVCLAAKPERICSRMMLAPDKRPLAKGKTPTELLEYIDATLAARSQYYEMAQICIESTHLENKREIDTTVENFLGSIQNQGRNLLKMTLI